MLNPTYITLIKNHHLQHLYVEGAKKRKISLNEIITVDWKTRKKLHDQIYNMYHFGITSKPAPVGVKDVKLRISFGFAPSPKTKNFDLDNLSYLQKIFIDVLSRHWGFNDNFRHIVEVRTVVLPERPEEAFIVQVQQVVDEPALPTLEETFN